MSGQLKKLQPNDLVGNRWEVKKMIGEGGFGAVYEVKDTSDENIGKLFALKVEDSNAPLRERVMRMEVVIMRRIRMKRATGGKNSKRHFCELEAVRQAPPYRYIVMTFVGESVSYLRRRCGQKLSGRTVAHVAVECLIALQELHDIGVAALPFKVQVERVGSVNVSRTAIRW